VQIAPLLLVTSLLAAPQAASAPVGVESVGPVAVVPASSVWVQARGQSRSSSAARRSRAGRFGLGGNLAASTRRIGGNLRYWVTDRLGLQLTASWYPARNTGTVDRTSTTLVAPSVIYMLVPFDATKDVNLRPYAGGGLNYARTSVPVNATRQQVSDARGTGGQVFGGVELTFADAEQIAVSGEVVHYWLPGRFLNSDAVQGTTFVGYVYIYF